MGTKSKQVNHEILTQFESSEWFVSVTNILSESYSDSITSVIPIPIGHCCAFSNSIPTPWPKPDLTFPEVSHTEKTIHASCSDSDDEYVPLQVLKKKARHNFINNT